MNTIEKSLLAIDKLYARLSEEELDLIIAKTDAMPAIGPTVREYLKDFNSFFVNNFPINTNKSSNYYKHLCNNATEVLRTDSICLLVEDHNNKVNIETFFIEVGNIGSTSFAIAA